MQTVTGKLRMVGQTNVVALAVCDILERFNNGVAGVRLATVTADANGDFSFQLRPGRYFFVYGNDQLPFRIRETAGTTTIDQLVEQV